MSRTARLRAIMSAVLLSALHSPALQAQDAYIGIYADSLGTTPCATLASVPGGLTLYIIAKVDTAVMDGFRSAEYRIEISNPSGWIFSYTGPAAATDLVIGNPLDTLPDSADSSGLRIIFSSCRYPTGTRIPMGTISAINGGPGQRTELRVRPHSEPSNPQFRCPLFTLCDSPVFTKLCMSPSLEAPCSYQKTLSDNADPVRFVFVLDVGDEPTPVAMPGIMSQPLTQDIVGDIEGYQAPPVIATDSILAEWNFDTCLESGWLALDNRMIEEGVDFGQWGRLFEHITDNDFCTENTTCAWLWTDDTTPTHFNEPSMAFGPDGFVIRNWLDNILVSP